VRHCNRYATKPTVTCNPALVSSKARLYASTVALRADLVFAICYYEHGLSWRTSWNARPSSWRNATGEVTQPASQPLSTSPSAVWKRHHAQSHRPDLEGLAVDYTAASTGRAVRPHGWGAPQGPKIVECYSVPIVLMFPAKGRYLLLGIYRLGAPTKAPDSCAGAAELVVRAI